MSTQEKVIFDLYKKYKSRNIHSKQSFAYYVINVIKGSSDFKLREQNTAYIIDIVETNYEMATYFTDA